MSAVKARWPVDYVVAERALEHHDAGSSIEGADEFGLQRAPGRRIGHRVGRVDEDARRGRRGLRVVGEIGLAATPGRGSRRGRNRRLDPRVGRLMEVVVLDMSTSLVVTRAAINTRNHQKTLTLEATLLNLGSVN